MSLAQRYQGRLAGILNVVHGRRLTNDNAPKVEYRLSAPRCQPFLHVVQREPEKHRKRSIEVRSTKDSLTHGQPSRIRNSAAFDHYQQRL
jgi:hypothetical protein